MRGRKKSMGVLDIYGFEIFEVSTVFWQYCYLTGFVTCLFKLYDMIYKT